MYGIITTTGRIPCDSAGAVLKWLESFRDAFKVVRFDMDGMTVTEDVVRWFWFAEINERLRCSR